MLAVGMEERWEFEDLPVGGFKNHERKKILKKSCNENEKKN